MSERKLTRGLDDIAPNNSDKAVNYKKDPRNNKDSKDPQEPKERKKMKPVVKGPVVQQKPTFWSKFKGAFMVESGNIGEFIVYDILIPGLRNTISEMGFGLIEMFFGRGYGRGSSDRLVRDKGRSYFSYNSISDRDKRDRREVNRDDRARHDFGNIIYTSRGEAEEVLSNLVDLTIEYGEATVGAFYELSNIEPNQTDYRYGWTNLRDAYTERIRGGYTINFPQPRPL